MAGLDRLGRLRQLLHARNRVHGQSGLAAAVLGDHDALGRGGRHVEDGGEVDHGQDLAAHVAHSEHGRRGAGHRRDLAELGHLEHVSDRQRVVLVRDPDPHLQAAHGRSLPLPAAAPAPFDPTAASCSAALRISTMAPATCSAASFCWSVARMLSSSTSTVERISSPTSRACLAPCSVAKMVALVSSWTAVTISWIDSVDRMLRSASLRTSLATTAKPRPASPALAASIAAFSASRLVCSAISLMSSSASPIFCERSPKVSERVEIASTCSCISRIVSPVCSAAVLPARALPAIDAAVAFNSSIVDAASAIAADCSLVADAESL